MRIDSSRIRPKMTAVAVAIGLILTACGNGDTTAPEATGDATVAGSAVVAVSDDAALGRILSDGDGMTLYLFTSDTPGVSTCVDGCLAAWPPLLTEGAPVAQGGADASLLGTLTRDDGTVQVTYNGWPLYFFASDVAAGDVAGQGVNDVWFVIAPDGSAIEAGEAAEVTVPSDGMDSSGSDSGMESGGSPATGSTDAY